MKLAVGQVVVAACIALWTVQVCAQEVTELRADRAERMAELLVAVVGKIESPQVKVDGDTAKAAGLKIRNDGILVVPQTGLSETGDNRAVETEQGAPLAYLFMSESFSPVVDGKEVEGDKLRTVTITDNQGTQRAIKCFLLSVRKVSDDDWRLYVYGAEKKPLVESQFAEAAEEKTGPVALGIERVTGNQGILTVTVFGKHRASLTMAYAAY